MTPIDYLIFLWVFFAVYALFMCIYLAFGKSPYDEFRDVYDAQVDAIYKTIDSWKEQKP